MARVIRHGKGGGGGGGGRGRGRGGRGGGGFYVGEIIAAKMSYIAALLPSYSVTLLVKCEKPVR